MRSLYKSSLLLIGLLIASTSYGQIYKMKLAADEGNFKRLEKVCLDATEDKELKKKPETWYYLAQAYAGLAKDEFYFSKNPDVVKLAVKAVLKGKKRDENEETLRGKFSDVLDDVVEAQLKEAERQYNINKMSKAAKMYQLVNNMDSTVRHAYVMKGKCLIGATDTAQGEKVYRDIMQWYENDMVDSTSKAEQEIDPYVYFINKYWETNKFDSAKTLIANGRELFGNDAKLNFYHKKVTLEQIKGMPPSNLMLDYIQEVLNFDPTDEDLLHKENSVFIYLIKTKISSNKVAEGDKLIDRFVAEKVAKSNMEDSRKIKETDVFVEKKPENVLWKLAEYFQTYSHIESAKHTLNKYISATAKSSSSSDIAERWNIITKYAFDTKSFAYGSFVLQQAISKYPSNSDLKQSRAKIIAEKEVVRTTVDEQGALYSLMKDHYESEKNDDNLKRVIAINDKYIGLLTSANRFSTAKDVMAEQMAYAPAADHSERLRFIAKEDFYQNYYLTRTKGKDLDGNEIKPWIWNGSTSGCDEGSIDLDIQNKVANRINYFRRNAGVPEVLFDEATNEYCQKAALMMKSNNKLVHDPPRTWRCYSNEGAYAAKHSLLIKDANTTMAITYIMDDKNPTAGNRRWLLYPNGKVYGHGSTDDIAVIWALDDSGSADTMEYMDLPVTWPPKGDVPQLMLLSNWTFSIYRDLKDAKVEVKQDGKPLEVKVEKYVAGYGAPTLVFQPSINKAALPDRSSFDVTVTLSNGRKYSYTVRTFFYDPAR